MTVSKSIIAAAAALAASIATGSRAEAAADLGLRIELKAQVGVVCKLDFDSAMVTPDQGSHIQFGMVQEFCNAASGYRISLNFDPSMLQGARFQLGSDAVELGNSGYEVVTRYDAANIRQRPMSMTLARALTGPAAIALRIEAQI